MSERWIPMMAAAVGLLGGIGGAAIGGSIANEGQDKRFKNERLAERNNLLLETYRRYLQTAATAYVTIGILGNDSTTEKVKVAREVFSGEAEVRLVTDEEQVEDAAADLNRTVIENGSRRAYETDRDRFIEAAGRSLSPEAAFTG